MNKTEPVEYTIKPPGHFEINFNELWQYRELFYSFALRDIKVKYKQTLLGFTWAILQPLLMMVVFVFFFSKALNLPTSDIPAPIFYFSGLLLWNMFSSGMTNASNSMVNNANMIKKIYFPRMIIPTAGVATALFDLLMALMMFFVMIIYYEINSQLEINYLYLSIAFPLGILMTFLTTFGLGSLISALNVKYRDFRYIIPFMIQFLIFVTPVIYPVTIFDESPMVKYILALNPMSGAIMLGRFPFNSEVMDFALLGISTVSMIICVMVGIFVFRKTEHYFADLA